MALDRDFLLKHVGGEVYYFAIAVVAFRSASGTQKVAFQDSALVRARCLFDFFSDRHNPKNHYVWQIYWPPMSATNVPADALAQEFFGFISDRIAHVGKDRERPPDKDPWPGDGPGRSKQPDRLDTLAVVVWRVMSANLPLLTVDCRPALELMIDRAQTYFKSPSDAARKAMDPLALRTALGLAP